MSTMNPSTVLMSTNDSPFEQAHMAAASFLARYSGRTLETYRYDLRSYFEWCSSVGLEVLEAQRPHIELWRAASEERGLAASTIDRRLSTICGFYRFAHIDGRIRANPAQYVRRPRSTRAKSADSTGASSAPSCSRPSATTTTMPPWRPSWASMDSGSVRPVPPTSRTWASTEATEPCESSARATSRP